MYPPSSLSFVSTLKRPLSLFIALTLALTTLWAMPPQVARAAGFTVNSTTDAVDANPGDGVCATAMGECTIRAAIMEANALPGDDTITLPAGTYMLTIAGAGEDAAATGDLDITSNLTINGAAAASTIIDGNGDVLNDRVFHITGAFTVNVSGVTIQNGNVGSSDVGGGISNFGALTLTNSKVIRNTAWDGGGLINSPTGTLLLNNSIVSDNTAMFGGGIFQGPEYQPTQVSGILMLTNSAVISNTAIFGSGIANSSGIVTLDRSTVSNNSGTTIFNFNDGILTVNSSTISNNTAGYYAGIRNDSGTVSLNNSTISNNTANSAGAPNPGGIYNADTVNLRITILAGNLGSPQDCFGTLNSQGYNLIQNTTGCTIVGDLTGNVTGVDPLLGPLQDNGGPTFTHALLPGSPAIDAGNPALPGSGGNACEAADQRGVARPQGAACDIGAYEFVPAACATTVTIDFPPTTLPFPGGTNITNEFSDQGIVFSSDDSDLPPEFQKSLGSQENRVAANVGEGGTFYNLFRLIFISAEPVVSVSVTLRDSNYNPQTHTLTAFDATGVIVDSDSFTESDLFPDPFTLTVSSSAGIAFIVAIEQPFGAEMLESISYTTAALATFPTTPVLDNFNREDGGVGPNWRSAKAQGNYRIVDEELEALAGGAVYWKPESFGPDQEACVTLTQIDREGHHSVLLKVQHNDRGLPAWQGGTIAVFYDRLECCSQGFGIETYVPGLGWTTLATFDVVLQDGDQIGGRALADGTVQAFVNGVLIGEADAGPFFTDKGGSIGMWFLSPGWPHAILDDFSGSE